MTADDKSRRRGVTDEEHALWRSVTRTVSPLRRNRRQGGPKAPAPEAPAELVAKPMRVCAPSVAKQPAPQAKPPALAPLDRRARQRLSRGTETIDARLDLHGRTQSEAHTALVRFLRKAQASGARIVLVITGKGADATDGRGVLRRQVPLWLALPEFRPLVVGFSDAAIAHGGQGALYVRVRRGR